MLISLIVLSKDNPEELRATLSSIFLQLSVACFNETPSLEVIVVDGSSAKQSPAFFDQFSGCGIRVVYVYDFTPKGIYPGMNLGLACAKGDWVLFLNSGDSFFDSSSLSRLLHCGLEFENHFGFRPLVIFGQALICPLSGSVAKRWLLPDPAVHSIRRWLWFYYPNHQSLLVSGAWARAHPFQSDAPQSADFAWIGAALSDLRRVAYLPQPVVRFSLGGVSSTLPNLPTLILRLREPTRTWCQKFSEVVKFALRPCARHYPRLMALRSRLIGMLV